MRHSSRFRLAVLLVFAMSGLAQAAAVSPTFITSKLESEKSNLAALPFWVSLGGALGANPLQLRGLSLGGGWQMAWIGLDARVGFGSMSYGAVAVSPGPSDFDTSTAAGDPLAERVRPRNGSDPWTYLAFEPGISVSGRLFASSLPQFSERARFGLGYGSMSDGVNKFGFNLINYSFEGDIDYQWSPGSRWAIRAGVIYSAGIITKKDEPDATLGRLPVSWIQEMISVVYSFRAP